MRFLRGGFISTRPLNLLVALVFVVSAPLVLSEPAAAQSPTPSPPDQEWSVRDSNGFRSRNLSLGIPFQIRLDGRSLSPASTSIPDRKGSQKSGSDGSDGKPSPDPKNGILEIGYSSKPVSVVREMRLDPKRRALRIIDIFTNTESNDRNVRIDYQTSLSERGGTRFGGVLNQDGESREYGNGVPDDTIAALIFAERSDTQALPLFVWGQPGSRWPVNVQDVGSSLSLSYEGTIPANGKIVLLHWVAVAGLDKSVKLERTADLFWKDGRLVDPMVSAEIAPLVVNFTPDSLKAMAAPSVQLAQATGRLLKLEELCGKLSISRGEKDMLWMGKDEQFRGTVTGSAVQLRNDMENRTVDVPLEGVAAIRGGGGRGREHRVYLRNGAVLTGRATLQGCRLAGELGELTLDADALELLLMHVSAEDGKVPPNAVAFAELQNGALHWLHPQNDVALQLVTVFGGLPLSLGELWSLERRAEPPFNLIATLADGSRIHGVARLTTLPFMVLGADGKAISMEVRTAEIVRFGAAELLAREMALPGSSPPPTVSGGATDKPKTEPPARYCWLRDGSLLVGTLGSTALSLRTNGNEVEVKTEDIVRMTLDASNGNLASMELRSGAKMQGELVTDSLGWHLGPRKISLPAGWITEVMRKEVEAPAKVPPGTVTRNPGENDPLALPNGIPKENLVEMKVDYPKSSVEGPLRIAGTVNLPRVDMCDAESVKKRLSFLVPKGAANVALKKPVTVSAPDTVVGVLASITDGSAKDDGGEHVAIGGGVQWVQIDLGESQRIWKVLLWHYHRMPVVYEDVIVQMSDDPKFAREVKTLFNNDHDNSSGFGTGPDTAYIETNYGWLMDGMEARGRYIRFYSRGNSYSERNDYLEAMVFGTPVDGAASVVAPAKPESKVETMVMTPRYPKPEPAAWSEPFSVDSKLFPHFQKPDFEAIKARLYFKVPIKASIVSVKKPVSCSVASIKPEDLLRVTNGTAEFPDMLELPGGLQWVQIDLGAPHQIFKILAWHRFDYFRRVYHDVVVQVSADPDFKKEVTTLFNNDHDDSAKLGKGSDPAYLETNHGMLFEGRGATARYVRLYSRGNSKEDKNHYCEVLVAGLKVGDEAKPTAVPGSAPETPSPASASAPTPAPSPDPVPTPKPPATAAATATTAADAKPTPNDPLALPRGFTRDQLEEVKPRFPKPMYIGRGYTHEDGIPNFESMDFEKWKQCRTFLIPKGGSLVSQGATVTSSDPKPVAGELSFITDGDADGAEANFVELAPGLQWVQLDLGASNHIWKVLLWHYHRQIAVFYDVVVQVSDDPKFATGVQTIFNNDHDNSSGLGAGPDPNYVETNNGRLIDGCGAKGRYLRFYSSGGKGHDVNHYLEISVYGTPSSSS